MSIHDVFLIFRAARATLAEAREERNIVLKSGVGCMLMLDMDDGTVKRHFRLTQSQFDVFSSKLICDLGNDEHLPHSYSRIPMKMKGVMFLWYHGQSKFIS